MNKPIVVRIDKRGSWYSFYFGNSMTWQALFALEINLSHSFTLKKGADGKSSEADPRKGIFFRLVLVGWVFFIYVMPFRQKTKHSNQKS
jgi:hypothetical protein